MLHTRIDFDKITGRIKPFHCINNAPLLGTDDRMFSFLKTAGIPFSRLHDTGGRYGGFCFVDIENIFRDFGADPDYPAAYDFAFTDWLIKELVSNGVEPFFRLGATIENSHRIKAYHIFPPKDNLKWARICEGIIKHYNCGWANGFRFNIRYWEIWNEPDNAPDISDNPMWKGTKEQYFALYETAAVYLKEKFPEIKIGGYASCGFYALYEDGFVETANSSSRTGYFIEFFHAFLKHISSPGHRAPLDFFSWHSYDTAEKNCRSARYVRSELDRYGFSATESILNEWNPGTGRRGTEADACYISDMICALHETPLDMLMYYDGQVHGDYQGLFDPLKHDIFPAYHALSSFNELYRLGNEVSCSNSESRAMLAAADGGKGLLLVPNKSDSPLVTELELSKGWKLKAVRILDGTKGLVRSAFSDSGSVHIPPMKIALLEFEK